MCVRVCAVGVWSDKGINILMVSGNIFHLEQTLPHRLQRRHFRHALNTFRSNFHSFKLLGSTINVLIC